MRKLCSPEGRLAYGGRLSCYYDTGEGRRRWYTPQGSWVFRSVLSASIDAAFRLEFYESPYNSSSWQSTLGQWCFKLKIISSIVTRPLKILRLV